MYIARNPEAASLYKKLILLIVVFLLLSLLASLLGMSLLKAGVSRNIAAVTGALIQRYPDEEQTIISQLKQTDQETVQAGQALLASYGYDMNDVFFVDSLVRQYFAVNSLLSAALVIAVSTVFLILLTRFLKLQYSRINDVTQYTKVIQSKDYTLDIRDNSEGDISMLKNEIYKITTMLSEQAEALQKDRIILSDSIADISHQLKTPMTSLFVLNDLLSGDIDAETRQKFHQKIKSQLQRMEWLVTSLLKLSKLDAGTAAMKKEPVNVSNLVKKALEPISVPIEIKMQRIEIEGDSGITFTGDYNWTAEALVNILKNCVEHTPEGGIIRISFSANPIYTVITISDNGQGIDKEDIPYIFNRFYKGKNAGDDSVGIGLAMARAIIESQNGDISVQSEIGRGTTFTIKFFRLSDKTVTEEVTSKSY